MVKEMTVKELIKKIEVMIDEKTGSYNNYIAWLNLLSMLEEITYFDEPETSYYAKKL
jgi:predicted ATP-dependent Lon-type protease